MIPQTLQKDILQRLHKGHQGITKCRLRARDSVWWLKLSNEIEEMIRKCQVCCKEWMEPMIPSHDQLPSLPWAKVATDLFQWRGKSYLLIVDYYSRYIEISKLTK